MIFFERQQAASLLPYGKTRIRRLKNSQPYGTGLRVYGTGSLPYDTRLQVYDAGSPYTSTPWGTGDFAASKGKQRAYSYKVLLRKRPEIRDESPKKVTTLISYQDQDLDVAEKEGFAFACGQSRAGSDGPLDRHSLPVLSLQ